MVKLQRFLPGPCPSTQFTVANPRSKQETKSTFDSGYVDDQGVLKTLSKQGGEKRGGAGSKYLPDFSVANAVTTLHMLQSSLD